MKNLLEYPIIAFDIGGTWSRSALVLPGGKLLDYDKRRSVSYKTHQDYDINALQRALVDYILQRSQELRKNYSEQIISTVSISIAGPVNAKTEVILNSGPIWGYKSKPFDLKDALRRENSDTNWLILNDLSAAISFYAQKENLKTGRLSLMTISTGSGIRIFDFNQDKIPEGESFSIQGEIGHIPISFFIKDKLIHSVCDCGGQDHFNAFCSGRGINKMLPLFAENFSDEYKKSCIYAQIGDNIELLSFSHLIDLLNDSDPFGLIILQHLSRPVANVIIYQLTLDPEVHKIMLMGGVVHSLHPHYYRALLRNLNEIGMSQSSDVNVNFFNDRVIVAENNDYAGVIGAAFWARQC